MSLLIKKILEKIKKIDNVKADKINITSGVEYETGQIIDGKKEYGKRINVGYLESGYKEIAHGITGWTKITELEGLFYNESSNTTFTIPRSHPTEMEKYGIDLTISTTNIMLTCGTNYNGATFIGIVTVCYLKN